MKWGSAVTGIDSPRIKILRIIARMNIGGPAIQVTTLMNHIPKDQVEQLLVTGECEDGEEDYLDFNNIELDRVRIPKLGRSVNLLDDIQSFMKIRSVIKDFRPDIVHTHTFKAGLLGRLAALSLRNSPLLVHTFHGHILNGYLGKVRLRILKSIERALAVKTDVLVAVGEKVKEELLEVRIGDSKNFEVVPPGFPMKKRVLGMMRSIPLESEQLHCLWVGRFTKVKAPERVLEITRSLLDKKVEFQFSFAGDGPLRNQIQQQCELESLPIEFLGWIGDIEDLLSRIDLLILTSINEGTPIAIIEAQRLGIPVIATDVGSVKEVISHGKSGYAIDFDASRFAELIEDFGRNRDTWREFSLEAIRFSGEKFAPERLVRDYLRIYTKLMIN